MLGSDRAFDMGVEILAFMHSCRVEFRGFVRDVRIIFVESVGVGYGEAW